MTRFISRAGGVALSLSLFASFAVAERVALAQPAASAADLESARELILKGRELREKGDLPGALEKLKAAHALAHTPITGIELARTHAALKQPLEARDVCLAIGRMPVTREETSRSKEAREEAAKLADDMKPKIATLSVQVRAPKDRVVLVKVDGVEVPPAAVESRKVNPGKHVVTARIDDGPEATANAEVGEGETRALTLEPTVPAVKAVAGPVTPIVPKPDEYVDEKRMSPLVPIGFALGGIGLVAGTVTGLLAVSIKGSLDTCVAKECYGDSATDLERAKTMASVSTVAFVIGGVGTTLGVIGLFTPSTVRTRRGGLSVSPYVAGMGAGLNGTF